MLITLSTIICIAHLAKATSDALDVTSSLLTMERATGIDLWSDMGQATFDARVAMGEALEDALCSIGISPDEQWTVSRTLGKHTKRFSWEAWPT